MEPLRNLFHRQSSIQQHQASAKRLQTYIKKKHGFNTQISFRGNDLLVHVQNSSQAALLSLDKLSLEQISGYLYEIKITVKPPK